MSRVLQQFKIMIHYANFVYESESGELCPVRSLRDENDETWFVVDDILNGLDYIHILPDEYVSEENLMKLSNDFTDVVPSSLLGQTALINVTGIWELFDEVAEETTYEFKQWFNEQVYPYIHGMRQYGALRAAAVVRECDRLQDYFVNADSAE